MGVSLTAVIVREEEEELELLEGIGRGLGGAG